MADYIEKNKLFDLINALTVDGNFSQADAQHLINYLITQGDMEGSPRDMMQVRRGFKADLPSLVQGEVGYCFDTKELYIGGINGNELLNTLEYVSIIRHGGVGNGVFDNTDAFTSANAVNGNVTVSDGDYFIGEDIVLGNLSFINTGAIVVPDGVTVTVDNIFCEADVVCIKGSGTVVINSCSYSIAWFEGNSINEKWDFLCRGMSANYKKYVYVPIPRQDDPASTGGVYAPNTWKVTAPLMFDNNQNEMIFDSDAMYTAVNTCKEMFVISRFSKIEELYFPKGLILEGGTDHDNPIADYGIVMHGGARVVFDGTLRIKSFKKKCFYIVDTTAEGVDPDLIGVDELHINGMLECTAFGEHGFYANKGSSGFVFSKIASFFTNGAYPDAVSYFQLEGTIRSLTIGKIIENYWAPMGYADVSEAIVGIYGTTKGHPANVTVSEIYASRSTKPGVKVGVKTGFTNIPNRLTIENIFTLGTNMVVLEHSNESYVNNLRSVENALMSTGNATNVVYNGRLSEVDYGTRPIYINGMLHTKALMGVNTVFSFALPKTTFTGTIEITTDQQSDIFYMGYIRNGEEFKEISNQGAINIAEGVLNGTTGLVDKLNISLVAGVLYVENRTPSPNKNVKVRIY